MYTDYRFRYAKQDRDQYDAIQAWTVDELPPFSESDSAPQVVVEDGVVTIGGEWSSHVAKYELRLDMDTKMPVLWGWKWLTSLPAEHESLLTEETAKALFEHFENSPSTADNIHYWGHVRNVLRDIAGLC